ncbi:AMP-binding protein [Acidithiobacillus sp. MC6.1]|nr:AMP-binding protein [Acidithiobacillus sp. MC6.1]
MPNGWVRFYELFSAPQLPNMDDGSTGVYELDEPAITIFTSGTTSLPKGAAHSNRSIGSSLQSHRLALKLDPTSWTCCHMPTSTFG